MTLERIWYEGSPYLYATTGVLSATDAQTSWLMSGSASLLVCAALTILAFRWMHRHDTGAASAACIDERESIRTVTDDVFAK